MYPIKIGRTRTCFFTKSQKNKLEAGIQIFLKAVGNQRFKENVLQFEWVSQYNKRFHRFYHAGGLSNRQVLERFENYKEYFEELGVESQLVVMPFNSRQEIENYNSLSFPMIWLSLNCINNDWYTPVHVASAICHELAVSLGLDSSIHQISNTEYNKFKAPEYLGKLVMQISETWKDSITDIGNSFKIIDKNQFNYFPASKVLNNIYPKSIQHSQTNFESLITSLLIEQETLISLQDNLTVSETTRLVCIEEVLLKLNTLKSKLAECSLDGSELDFKALSKVTGKRRRG